jgi:hypothetical protein
MSLYDDDEGYRDREEWRCPNCQERWNEVPETRTCEYEHCDVSTCPVCDSVCASCGRHLCADHFMFADCGDGVRRFCKSCLEDFAESERESQEAA